MLMRKHGQGYTFETDYFPGDNSVFAESALLTMRQTTGVEL